MVLRTVFATELLAADLPNHCGQRTGLPPAVLVHACEEQFPRLQLCRVERDERKIAATQIGTDTRVQPKPEEEVELDPQIRPLCEPGGIILFSGAQLHSSVPNTSTKTRFSIDLRTVHVDDAAAGTGAPNIDSECTGTTMGDYLRCSDLAHVPDYLVAEYDTPARATADTGA